MTVFRELSEIGDWTDIEPRKEDDPTSLIGYYNGEPVKVGKTGKEIDLDDLPKTYMSGRYKIETRTKDDTLQVKVSYEAEETNTKIRRNEKGYYELPLPPELVSEAGYDDTIEFTRTVQKRDEEGDKIRDENGDPVTKDIEVERGVKVDIGVECKGDHLKLHLNKVPEDVKGPTIRPIQHKLLKTDGREYDQYFIYFHRELAAATGIAGSDVKWHIEDDHLVGVPESHSQLPVRDSPITDEEYAGLAYEDRILKLSEYEETEQGRLIFNEPQSKALGYLANKAEVVKKNEKLATLVECTDEGTTFVLHSAPEKLPEERSPDSVQMTVQIHNWHDRFSDMYGDLHEDEPEEIRSKLKTAGNQMMISYPKALAHMFDLLGEEIYWWPTKDTDEYYGTGETILVGIPVRQLQD